MFNTALTHTNVLHTVLWDKLGFKVSCKSHINGADIGRYTFNINAWLIRRHYPSYLLVIYRLWRRTGVSPRSEWHQQFSNRRRVGLRGHRAGIVLRRSPWQHASWLLAIAMGSRWTRWAQTRYITQGSSGGMSDRPLSAFFGWLDKTMTGVSQQLCFDFKREGDHQTVLASCDL